MKKIIIVSAVVLLIASAVYIFEFTAPSVSTTGAAPSAPAAQANGSAVPAANNAAQQADNSATSAGAQAQADDTPELSPEMKESLRKMLFQHGPKTTITHPDGTIEMPMNGRYTQMPVAIQKPDGTIVIREYSVVPENKNEKP
ncbi:MAG: hypothetical protein H7A09_09135 [Oceanospirillaceae bacterium]|nr:hypothetical protein [Oceanospirillaceae bacterium]MCP5349624.1 hypothetical protein [Oceanospirillaceae bacterium]